MLVSLEGGDVEGFEGGCEFDAAVGEIAKEGFDGACECIWSVMN